MEKIQSCAVLVLIMVLGHFWCNPTASFTSTQSYFTGHTDSPPRSTQTLRIHGHISDFVYPNNTGTPVRVQVLRHSVWHHSNGIFVDTATTLLGTTTTVIGDTFSLAVPALASYPDYLTVRVSADGYVGVSQVLYQVLGRDCNIRRIRLKPVRCYDICQHDMEEGTPRYDLERALHPEPAVNVSPQPTKSSPRPLIDWSRVPVVRGLTYRDPARTWLWVHNLRSGYYGAHKFSGNQFAQPRSGLYIHRDLFISGVVAGEMGGFTIAPHALGAQAVTALTYAWRNQERRLPANSGHAFSFIVSDAVAEAVRLANARILRYQGRTVDAYYAARCSGDRTQAANMGMWAPGRSARLYGTAIPYLPSVRCTGHCDCSEFAFREHPCRAGEPGRYIYGHGVGMCQRGAIDWAEAYGWTLEQIVLHTYVGCTLDTL
jgi:hypothetical protein